MRTALALAAVLVLGCSTGAATPTGTPVPTNTPTPTSSVAPGPPTTAPPQPTGQIAAIGEFRSQLGRLPVEAATPDQLGAVVDADADFALQLYALLSTTNAGNVFLSPYSISTALSMAYAGARGKTAAQMAATLGIGSDADAWHAGRNRLELTIGDTSDFNFVGDAVPMTVEPTNAFFGQSGYPFKEPFLDVLAANYGAGVQALDIRSDPDLARLAINAWVAQRTHDRIKDLLASGTIDELTRGVLVNAIYFKANWAHQFDPDLTVPAPFRLLDGTDVEVPTMRLEAKNDYAAGDGWSAARLHYWGASMIVIVPDAGRFAEIEAALDPQLLQTVRDSLAERELTLDLPRWQSAYSAHLVDPLTALGMQLVFEPDNADLSGIADIEQLYLSDVIHQANITVNEQGTEAAAATAAVVEALSAPPRASLSVDRPFLYLIEDDATGEILFMGRVLDPRGD